MKKQYFFYNMLQHNELQKHNYRLIATVLYQDDLLNENNIFRLKGQNLD